MDKIMSLGLKSHLGHVGMETANIDRYLSATLLHCTTVSLDLVVGLFFFGFL